MIQLVLLNIFGRLKIFCSTSLTPIEERGKWITSEHTYDVLGNVLARYFNWLTEANFVDGSDTALVLCLVDEVLDNVTSVLQVSGDIATDPICGIGPLALNQVSQDGASTIASRGIPCEADGAVGCVCHTGIHHWARRS